MGRFSSPARRVKRRRQKPAQLRKLIDFERKEHKNDKNAGTRRKYRKGIILATKQQISADF
jgi:hypothetical protein